MAADSESSRREFLGALSAGVTVAGTLAGTSEATAQSAAFLKIVDFHNHYISPSWTLTNVATAPAAARAAQEKINANMQSEGALLASIEQAGVAARVINSPTAFIEDADGNPPPDATRRINDEMAETCIKHPSGSNLTFESWKGFPSGSLHASLAHANRNFHYSQAY